MLPASRAQTSSRHGGAGVLLRGLAGQRLEVAVAPVAAGEAEQHEAGRQQAAVGQVVDGRDQLLAGQVAGDAEDDQRARLRDRAAAAGRAGRAAGSPAQPRPARGRAVTPCDSPREQLREPGGAVGEVQPQQRAGRVRRAPAGRRRPGPPAAGRTCTAGPAPAGPRSTAPVICRNTPTCGPPLWYWPVECRNRGPQPKVTGRPRPRGQPRPQPRPPRRRRSGRGRPSPRGSRGRATASSSAAQRVGEVVAPPSRSRSRVHLDRAVDERRLALGQRPSPARRGSAWCSPWTRSRWAGRTG